MRGVPFDVLTQREVVAQVFAQLDAGTGGHLITPNVDILRRLRERSLQPVLRSASIVVGDGKPVLWASQLRGTPLPERVTGADLIWSLTEEAARRGRRVYLLGGGPGVADEAGERLSQRHAGLHVVGTHCPPLGFEQDPSEMSGIRARLTAARPDVVFVGLGFPKQDLLAARLRDEVPSAWFIGCGAALDFAAGRVTRAPRWMQEVGLEWLARLWQEPRRLGRRYLIEDAPFACGLLATSAVVGVRHRFSRARRRRQ